MSARCLPRRTQGNDQCLSLTLTPYLPTQTLHSVYHVLGMDVLCPSNREASHPFGTELDLYQNLDLARHPRRLRIPSILHFLFLFTFHNSLPSKYFAKSGHFSKLSSSLFRTVDRVNYPFTHPQVKTLTARYLSSATYCRAHTYSSVPCLLPHLQLPS